MRGPPSSAAWAGFWLVSATICAVSCAEPPAPIAPRPTLALTAPASEPFAALRTKWAHGTREERIAMEESIRTLRAHHAKEPVARLADVYLAWIRLEQGDSVGAEAAALRDTDPAPGNTHDLTVLVRGAALGRQGKHDAALDLLLPLLSRLLDAYARELLHEEATAIALAAHRWSDALQVLDAWHHDAEGDAAAADPRVAAALAQIPGPALERALERYRELERLEDPFARRLAARLADLAVERGDATLAQRLLRRLARKKSDLLALGVASESVQRLAAARAGIHATGRTVGLVLAGEDDTLRERSASWTFGLERANGAPGGEPLPLTLYLSDSSKSRGPGDPPESTLTDAGLRDLVQRGAIALVGGETPSAAAHLARFAEDNEIAALLLAPPIPPVESPRWSFVSAPEDDGSQALATALEAAGASRIGRVGTGAPLAASALGGGGGEPHAPCPDLSAHVHGTFPFTAWQQAGVDAIILGGSEGCARSALRALSAMRKNGYRPRLALTLDTAALGAPAGGSPAPVGGSPSAPLVAHLDDFPFDAAGREREDRSILSRTGRKRADIWAVRGHDLGLALRTALAQVPANDSADETVVRGRRLLVQGIFREVVTSNAPRNVVAVRSIPSAVPVVTATATAPTAAAVRPGRLPRSVRHP